MREGICGATATHPLHTSHQHFQDFHIDRIDQGQVERGGQLICLEVFEDGDNKKYVKHLMTLQCPQAMEGVKEMLLLVTRELGNKKQILKALCKLRTGKTHEAKELHLLEVTNAESQVIEQCENV